MKISALLAVLILGSCSWLKKPTTKVVSMKPVWSKLSTFEHKLGPRLLEMMEPVIYKDIVIHGNSFDSITAYKKSTGKLVWKKAIENGAGGGGAIYKDSILIGGNDGHFYRLKADDGSLVWSFPTRTESLSAPLVYGSKVFFLSGNNTLYCLNAETGEKIWIHSRRTTTAFSIRGGSRPAVRSDKLFVGFADGSIVAFNEASGKVLWEQRLNRNKKFRDIDSNPVISGFELYISGYDDALYNLDWSTGDVNWKYESGGFGEVVLTDQNVYTSTTDGRIVSLDRKTGKQIWSKEVRGVASRPALYKGYLIFGESEGELRMIDSGSGEQISSFEPGRGVFTPPVVSDKGEVFFASNQSNMYSVKIDFDLGASIWHWEKGSH